MLRGPALLGSETRVGNRPALFWLVGVLAPVVGGVEDAVVVGSSAIYLGCSVEVPCGDKDCPSPAPEAVGESVAFA